MQTTIQKPKLIVFCALGGLLDDYTTALQKKLSKSVLLNKNTLTDALLEGKNHTTPEYQLVKKNMYAALNNLAVDQLKLGNTVILHGYYGDKLTKPGTVEFIAPNSDVYDVRIIYLHCSGDRHKEILAARNSNRDDDKKGDKYEEYRPVHIQNHLRELAKVSNVLLVDIETDSFDSNISKIVNYIDSAAPALQISNLNAQAERRLTELTPAEAFDGLETFKKVLSEVQALNITNPKVEEPKPQNPMTTLYSLGVATLSFATFYALHSSMRPKM